MLARDLAVDFGSVNTRVANAKGRVIYEQPSLVALNHDSGRPVFYGAEALGRSARSAGQLNLVHPVAFSQLQDISVAEHLLKHVIEQIGRDHLRRRRVLATSPLDATPVQLRAMTRALERSGVHKVRFLAQPLAAALGAKIAIEAPVGTMVIDIGGQITNIASIALGGVILGSTVKFGGESLVGALTQRFLEINNLVVEPSLARGIRDDYGLSGESREEEHIEVMGRDGTDGAPRSIRIRKREITEVVRHSLTPVFDMALHIISNSPPEISNDIMTSGIVLAGGGSLLPGLGEDLALTTGVPVHVFDDPGRLGVIGASRCLSSFQELEDSFTTASPR